MLLRIGAHPRAEGFVELLLDCHLRIRSFARLAVEIGARAELLDDELTQAAAHCERYFTQALPLHIQDEEQSLLPRLQNQRPEVDVALATMQAQHSDHEALLRDMLDALRAVVQHPRETPLRASLQAAATRLVEDFERHLTLEERLIFPAARTLLSPREQALAMAELRARRSAPRDEQR